MAAGIKGMKASVAATLLAVQGLPMSSPMDLVLATKAKESNKSVRYLEASSLQASLLEKWMDIRMLRSMLADVDDVKKSTLEGFEAYIAGDEEALGKLSADFGSFEKSGRDKAEFDEMMTDMLYARNKAWIPELQDIMKDGKAFVAVGAAHLIGKGSVVELLTSAGYTVNRGGNAADASAASSK